VKVFLFAHQDDEIFALPHILNFEKKLFIYLTSGVSEVTAELKLETRTVEAKYVFEKYLSKLNSVANWWGLENSVPEGELHKFVSVENLASIEEVIKNQGVRVTQILTTTFEGAHQDHDSAAVISRKLASVFLVNTIEVSTYPQWFSKFYSFRVLAPRHPSESFRFERVKTLQLALRLMASYKSQRATWIGLGLATLGTYAFRKYRASIPQPVRLLSPCFYEFRGRALQSEVLKHLASVSM
jgi:hypothetical protein